MLKYQVNRKVLITIYMSFIRPILEYADVVWDNCTTYEANLLESVQIEAGRIITGLRINSSKTKLYEELGWEPLYKRREKHKLILLYKIMHGLTPQYLHDIVQPFTVNIHNYNLRNAISESNFRIPFCNSVSYDKSFIPNTFKLWNNLPESIKTSPSIEIFKKRLKSDVMACPEYFNEGNRKENIILCQMRNDASNLNKHLLCHHLSDSSACPRCNHPNEDPSHFFMYCPSYSIQRQNLLNTFATLKMTLTFKIFYMAVQYVIMHKIKLWSCLCMIS